MVELTVAPDPSLWSLVPHRDDAVAWAEGLLANRTPEQRDEIIVAAELALCTREAADDGITLLLCEPVSHLFATLTILVTDVAALTTSAEAEQLALTITATGWAPATTAFDLADQPGWRVSVLMDEDGQSSNEQATILTQVRTSYIFALHGRLAIAQLPPLSPDAAAFAMALSEQVLPTIEVTGLE